MLHHIDLTRGYWFDCDKEVIGKAGGFPSPAHRGNLLKHEWLPIVRQWLKENERTAISKWRTNAERLVKIWTK